MKSNMISGHVGIFLRKARKEKNMTGKQLARLMNVSQQQISRYEIGATAITVDQLANFLLILDKKWVDVFKYLESEFSDEKEINRIDNKKKYILWKGYPIKNYINNF
ncbi:TPA: helix-turn-helix domain-containing protein [Proteus mirabilis]|nr:helix-turn-helix transcriptional regulator [Proteus mirabilis]HEJ9414510.1 helix-turn-helix transcriptional regulator [Proteus mirabilis]HEJ9415150.1 helix-turn-helix transcriptional regulator [Proteus mirabilis]HEK1719393.1 helix-turn-helix transcriptional regulator [Proteus mirabilis]HEK2725513.1 helix-turn-helix transcriptional regulator [Proteus mirabilis]